MLLSRVHKHGAHRCRHKGPAPIGIGPLMPLSMASPDEEVYVTQIRGGRGFRRRLADLGLSVGCPVRIIRTDPSGQLIVALKGDSRLALGHGIAHKIMVESRNEED